MTLLFLLNLGFAGSGQVDVVPGVLEDLTTVFVPYVQDLREASLLAALDSSSLVMAAQPEVRTEDVTDLNTAYAIRLS